LNEANIKFYELNSIIFYIKKGDLSRLFINIILSVMDL
jgi:hypothetical protein